MLECHKGPRGSLWRGSISERVAAGWKERSEVLRAALCQCVESSEKETSNVDSQYVGPSSVGIWGPRYGP